MGDKKQQILDLIVKQRNEYWEKFPSDLPKMSDEEQNFSDEQTEKLADDIFELIK